MHPWLEDMRWRTQQTKDNTSSGTENALKVRYECIIGALQEMPFWKCIRGALRMHSQCI